MAQRYFNLGDLFTAISNALRSLKGTSGDIVADDFPDEISAIPKKSSSDLTVSGATVTAPAGYYASSASKSVASGSATAPASISGSSATVSTSGTNTLTLSKTVSVTPSVTAGYVSSGTAGNSSVALSASVPLLSATTYDVAPGDRTISDGQYLKGIQTIRGVTTSGIEAQNIKTGVTVKVGDAGRDTRIKNIAGTFTAASTASAGRTAASSNEIVNGYSAWVDGAEVFGNIEQRNSSSVTVDEKAVIIPAGYYSDSVTKLVADGSVTIPNTYLQPVPTISVSSSGLITAAVSNQYGAVATPTLVPGYLDSMGDLSIGDVVMSGSNTKQLTTKAATTYNTSSSNQTIASGTYLTGTQTIRAVTTSNISPENIKAGVVVKVGDAGSAGRIKNVTGTYTGGPEGIRDKVHFFSASSFTLKTNNTSKNWDGVIEYSTNGTSWATWTGAAITAAESNYEYHIYLRGTGNSYLTMVYGSASTNARFVFTGSMIDSEGDLDALLDYSVASQGKYPSRTTYWAAYLFYQCTALFSAPTLDSIVLTANCYYQMFYGCTSLAVAPELPATTLEAACYTGMFQGCSSLYEPPKLPATSLVAQCYQNMFNGCTSLEKLPALPALKIWANSYNQMFRGCAKIKVSASNVSPYTNAYRIPVSGTGDGSASNAMSNMFYATGGSFTGTPTANTTYYTSNQIVS